MSDFEREVPRSRTVIINYGDDIQTIAFRELGDINRWPELTWINNLRSPYIVSSQKEKISGTLAPGDIIMIPSPTGTVSSNSVNDEIFATDLDCSGANRQLIVSNGDIQLISGRSNLVQQLENKLDVPRGRLRRHPRFGSLVSSVLGKTSGPLALQLSSDYAKTAILSDFRIERIISTDASVNNDKIKVIVKALTINGDSIVIGGDE